MLGWIVGSVLWILALLCLWKIWKNDKVKKFPINAKWFFGIFVFLSAYDVWISYFMAIWMHIATAVNPIFGTELALPVAIFAKAGQVLLIYLSLKYFSTKMTPKDSNSASVIASFLCCVLMFLVAINNEYQLYRAVYYAVHSGLFF